MEALNISSDLHLDRIDPLIPDSSPEDVNAYLRKQIFIVTKQNEQLQKDLSSSIMLNKKDQERITELATKIREFECDKSQFVDPVQLTNTKLVELSKKLRDKNAEVEGMKIKYRKVQEELENLKKKLDDEKTPKTEEEVKEVPKSKDEFKKLQDKFQQTHSKLMEEKNVNLKLKNDLKVANKLLQQEIGENFDNLSSYITKQNWRGRAQIIQELTMKNTDLKEKLKHFQGKPTTVESNNKHEEKEKKLEQLMIENDGLRNNLEDTKRKLTLTNGRAKALSSEIEVLKNKLKELKQTKEEDQEAINKLTIQVANLKESRQLSIEKKDKIIKQIQEEKLTLQAEIARLQCINENKDKQIDEKKSEIETLQRKIRCSRPTSSYSNRRPESAENKLQSVEAERSKLLELIQIQNERLQEERNSSVRLESALKFEKLRGAKLEANLARLELEQPKSTYSSRIENNKVSTEYLKDQLELAEEKIRALTKRLEIESFERKKDQQDFINVLKSRLSN